MKITINKEKYEVKYNLRAMFIFEQITKKAFSISSVFDEYALFYSCILAANKDCNLSFDAFIDWCDNHTNSFNDFTKYLNTEIEKRKKFEDAEIKKAESL